MKAGIFLVGTELLNGATIDTNSIYIAEELNKYGIEIEFKMTVRDVMDEIVKSLKYAKKNVDLVILTGGLGPTDDDITKEAMAKFLKKKLVVDEKEKKELLKKYKAYKNPNKTNFKEVEKPEGAISFKNDVGMAPAVYIDGMVYIAINDKLYKKNSYKNLTRIVTLCHEFCHYRQEYEARSGQVSSSAFNYIKCSLSSKLHTTDKFKEYDVNYKYKDSELEAESVGISDGLDFAGEYFSDKEYDKVKDSLKDRLVRSYSFYNNNMQEENSENISIRRDGEAYAIESIGTMISKKRSMFDEYPQLKKFYDKNGKVFSPIKIIDFYLYKYYSSNGCNMSHDVYREFFYYSIKRYELEDVYKTTSLINRKLFCVFLNEIIEDLAIDIDMMISYKLYKEDSDNLFKSISDFNRFYDFMMQYRLIDKSHISIIERSKNIISSYNSNVK